MQKTIKINLKSLGLVAIGLVIGYLLFHGSNPNARLRYGDSGLPKNCRAIIKGNIDGYNSGEFSAAAALDSIDRNCGEFGYSWDE